MLIIEDDPYYFLQFDKVLKEFTHLLIFVFQRGETDQL